jgi:hypothetical protein
MAAFVAIRSLAGITPDALAGAGARVKSCAAGMQSEGTEVRWLRSFCLTASSQTHCHFYGLSLGAVGGLDERAGLPFEQLLEVAKMTPAQVCSPGVPACPRQAAPLLRPPLRGTPRAPAGRRASSSRRRSS